MKIKLTAILWSIFILITMGCGSDDENIQSNPNTETAEITGSEAIQRFEKGSTPTEYGFHLYIPPEYDQNTAAKYPLLIYLHGGGGRGDGTANSLPGLVQDGVLRLIVDNRWNPTNPMIVIVPQSPGLWNADHLHDLIAYVMDTYPVVRNRVYMTGFSMGGRGCFDYVSAKGKDAYVAAVLPIAGWGETTTGSQFQDVAVWAFHGGKDNVVLTSQSIDMVNAINLENPMTPAKLSIYDEVGHDSWTMTYDDSGIGAASTSYDPFDMSVYDWMYRYEKKEIAPISSSNED